MDNPIIQTDIAEILSEIKQELKTTNDRLGKIEIGQTEIKGEIKALDVKTEQLNTRVGNVEFAVRGVLVGLTVVILGGFAMFFLMSRST